MKTIILLAIFIASSFVNLQAQEQKEGGIKWKVSADVVSTYVWRGVPGYSGLGGQSVLSPNIQPTVALSAGNLEIGAWGSVDFTGSYKETDLYVTYATKGLTIGVYDYYWDANWLNNRYFDYDSKTTGHIVELMLMYKFSGIPLSLTASSFVFGADKKFDTNIGAFDPEKNNYSAYFEVGYNVKGADLFLGVTPTDGYYGDYYGGYGGFAVVNMGITGYKTLKIGDLELPVKGTLAFNPQHEKAYIVFGITF